MKVKTSITVDKGLLETVDKLSGRNRSAFIEAAVPVYIAQMTRQEQNAKDLEIINQRADDLNQAALDVLEYQVGLVKRGDLYRVPKPSRRDPKRFRVFKKKTFVVPPSGDRLNRQEIRPKPGLRTKNIFLNAIALTIFSPPR